MESENKDIRIEKLEKALRGTRFDLQYYKGFYEGVKTIINLLSEDNSEIEVECAMGKLEGENAKKFKDFMDNLFEGGKK